jgi:hypothetical protein
VVMTQSMYRTYCQIRDDRVKSVRCNTHPNLPQRASGVTEVRELSGDTSSTKVGSHGELSDSGGGEDDDAELVEQSLTPGDREMPSDDNQVDEEHDREDCPELMGQ